MKIDSFLKTCNIDRVTILQYGHERILEVAIVTYEAMCNLVDEQLEECPIGLTNIL